MQELSTHTSLAEAQAAAEEGDWSLLSSWLQQVSVTDDTNDAALSAELDQSAKAQDALIEQALAFALDVLESGDFQDRWDVAKVFVHLGTRSLAPLINLLQDEDAEPELRWFVARILGEIHQPEALTALIELLKTSPNEDLRSMAATAVAGFGDAAIASLDNLLADPQTRSLAVRALAQIRSSKTIPMLLRVADDSDAAVREMAIDALSGFHVPQVVSTLVRALSDPTPHVRRVAVTGLGFWADAQDEYDLVGSIQPLLLDLNLEVCERAAIALGRLGTDAAATALFQMLQSPHTPESLQVSLIRSLGWMDIPTAWAYLEQALTSRLESQTTLQASVLQELIVVLGDAKDPEFRGQIAISLAKLLQSDHPAVRQAAVRQSIALKLGQLNNSFALEPLIQLLADVDAGVRLHAIAALKTLAPDAAYQRLTELSQDAVDPELRRGVAIALQEWVL